MKAQPLLLPFQNSQHLYQKKTYVSLNRKMALLLHFIQERINVSGNKILVKHRTNLIGNVKFQNVNSKIPLNEYYIFVLWLSSALTLFHMGGGGGGLGQILPSFRLSSVYNFR